MTSSMAMVAGMGMLRSHSPLQREDARAGWAPSLPGSCRSSKKKSAVPFSSSIRLNSGCLTCGRKGGSSVVAMASPRHLMGALNKTEGLRFAVVVARFNEIVTKLLLEGALETFKRYSVPEENIDVISVPGSFEIPVTAQMLGKSGKYSAVLCIGAVIRGDTTHYDAVANSAASGVLSASLGSGVPCIFGVLTCDDMDQDLQMWRRIGLGRKRGNGVYLLVHDAVP